MKKILLAMVAGAVVLATACGGKPKGDLRAGIAAFERQDYPVAAREIRPLAEHGDREAQYYMGRMAQVVPTPAIPGAQAWTLESASWYRKAAEQGHVDAQLMLGEAFGKGLGVMENHAESLKWFRLAADQGSPRAMAALASNYLGRGPLHNVVVAHALDTVAGERDPAFGETAVKAVKQMTDDQLEQARALAERLRVPGALVSKVIAGN